MNSGRISCRNVRIGNLNKQGRSKNRSKILAFLGIERQPLFADITVHIGTGAEIGVHFILVRSVAINGAVICRLILDNYFFALFVISRYILFINHIVRNRSELHIIIADHIHV